MEPKKIKNSLNTAKNIGPAIFMHLHEIGVYSLSDLAAMTSAKAYRTLCERNQGTTFPVCYYLYSLEGAILGVHWNDLPSELKLDLLQQVGKCKNTSA